MSSTPAEVRRKRRFRFELWPAVTTLLGLVVLVGLGTWQLQRLAWKEALIAAAEAKLAQPPRELPSGADLAEADYGRFVVHGRYLHDQAFAFGGTGQGHLRLLDRDGATLVCADTGGSAAYDFVLRIADGAAQAAAYTGDDFIL